MHVYISVALVIYIRRFVTLSAAGAVTFSTARSDNMTTVYKRFKHPIPSTSKKPGDEQCDLIIEVGWDQFQVHTSIIEAVIPYMLQCIQNSRQNVERKIVVIKDISAPILKSFIEFAYTGAIAITHKTVEDIIKAASILQLIDVQMECEKFIKFNLRLMNVCRVYHLADTLNCLSLKKKTYEYICRHIKKIAKTGDFLDTDIALIKDIASHKELPDTSTHELFRMIMRWIINKFTERRPYLFENSSDLMKRVKFGKITLGQIYDYVSEDDVITALTALDRKRLRDDLISLYNAFGKQKLITKDRIIMMDCLDSQRIITYNPYTDQWGYIETSAEDLKRFTCIVQSGQLYAFGGLASEISGEVMPSGKRYIFESKNWIDIPAMKVPRNWGIAVTSLGGYLYVCGGYHVNCFNNVEKYCIESNKWKSVSPMNEARGYLCAVSMQGYVYAIGGFNDDAVPLNSVERYDPQTDKWKMISPMHEYRKFAGAAALNGQIFVCGGVGEQVLNTVEVYDPVAKCWRYTVRMNTARSHLLVLAIMNKLWAIGGVGADGEKVLTVEMYDPEKLLWSNVSSLPTIGSELTGGVSHCCPANKEPVIPLTIPYS